MNNQKDELRIVGGNDFATQMTITALYPDGRVVQDFSLAASTEVVASYKLGGDSYRIQEYQVSGNDMIINWTGLGLGRYGFEVKGKFNGSAWRMAADFLFQIVDTNERANIPTWTVLVDGTYFVHGIFMLYAGSGGGGGEQSDWNETDPSSAAYIKNKPTIPTVPTNLSSFTDDLGSSPTHTHSQYLTSHQDISGKEDVTSIEAPVNQSDETAPITTLSTQMGKYYRIDVPVETLAVTLPAMTDATHGKSVVLFLTGGTTPNVTISSTAPSGGSAPAVHFSDGFEIKSGETYEVNCYWNGLAWIVASVKIVISNS